MALSLRPITFRDACAFVKEHHRHHKPPQGHKGTVAVVDNGRLWEKQLTGMTIGAMRKLDGCHRRNPKPLTKEPAQ